MLRAWEVGKMDKKELQVKMMLYMMVKSMDEIQKVDEEFREELEDFDDSTIQWKVGPIRANIVIKDGKYSFKMDDELDDPDVTMIIEDLDFGGRFLSGEEDGTAAYMSGDLQVEGDLQLTMSFGALAEYIGDYLAPIRPA